MQPGLKGLKPDEHGGCCKCIFGRYPPYSENCPLDCLDPNLKMGRLDTIQIIGEKSGYAFVCLYKYIALFESLYLPFSSNQNHVKYMCGSLTRYTLVYIYIYIYYPLYTNWPITNANLPHVIIQYILYFICQKLYWTVSGQLSNIGFIGQFQNEARGALCARGTDAPKQCQCT